MHVANSYRIVPVQADENSLTIATADPDNLDVLDDLKFTLGVEQVKPALCSEVQIDRALERYYKVTEQDDTIAELMSGRSGEDAPIADLDTYEIGDIENMDFGDIGAAADSAPVRKLLDLILLDCGSCAGI